jgi:hypothetical protein
MGCTVRLTVVRDGKAGESQRSRLYGLNDERQVGRVFDLEREGGPIPSGPLQDLQDDLHYATSPSSASAPNCTAARPGL